MSYYDFMITENGDISFVENDIENKRFNLKFYLSNFNAMNIKFNIERTSKIKNEKHMMNITFNLNKIKYNKKIFSVSDKDYIIQQIKIRLRTSLGELPLRKTFGSTLETQMHKDIQDKTVQKNIENIVSSIVSEFLKNYSIKVIPYIDRNNGYYQTFKINIYSNNSLILEYEME